MASVAEKNHEQEIAEVLAKSRPLFKDYAAFVQMGAKLQADLKAFDLNLVYLINSQGALAKRTRDAEANLAKVEKEAKQTLLDSQHSHKTLIENISRDRVELQRKMADLEKRERNAADLEQKYTLLCDAKEREVNAVKTLKK